MSIKTILISAYAVNPYKGSEDGTGWNISREIAKDHQVIVITRKNNIPHIERYLQEFPKDIHSNSRFIGYDLPAWAMWLKKRIGERGYVLYYYFWQLFLPFFIKGKKVQFDIAHAVNFHSDSVPTFLWTLGKPTMWGPVGHHAKVPKDFILPIYGKKAFIRDRFYAIFKWLLRNVDPFFKITVKKVDTIFVINSSIAEAMSAPKAKVVIVPAVATKKPNSTVKHNADTFTVLSVGRFHYMKGFDLTIRAFASYYHSLDGEARQKTQLVLVGDGDEKRCLFQLAKDLKINQKIKWVEWVERSEMEQLYLKANAFLFPSHEGAGMVVPEAMSYGIPVITLNNSGPGELVGDAGLKVDATDYSSTVSSLAEKLHLLSEKKEVFKKYSNLSKRHYDEKFTWEVKGNQIKNAYRRVRKSVAIFHPSSELYGADRILVNAINVMPVELKKVVYLKFQGPLVNFIQENTKNTKVEVIPFLPIIYRGIFNPKGIVIFTTELIRFALFLRKQNKALKFNSAYVNTLSTAFILVFLKVLKIPSYLHVHEIIESPKSIGWLTAKLGSVFAKKVVCVSFAVEKGLLEYTLKIGVKTLVIHNGIDQVLAKPKKAGAQINFYLFGRIMPKKGQWYLLDALKQIPLEQLKDTRFTLMGGAVPGKEDSVERLQKQIYEAGLSDVVFIKSFAANITEAMEDADVCLVPSMMKDPFPTTVLEAMSAGRPVIATNHGGAKEAIADSKAGLLVDPGKPAQLAAGILRLIQERNLIPTMGKFAQKQYLSAFTKNHFSQNWNLFLVGNDFV
ncbi:MAG: glycosyltransferase involved in cell wall biosynthesis [Roseivirga sp.]|jgi:glycosyltransferase involved in cell wall biosynthesis